MPAPVDAHQVELHVQARHPALAGAQPLQSAAETLLEGQHVVRGRAGQAVAQRLQHRTGARHLLLPHQQVQVDHGPLGRILIDGAGQRAALEDDNVYPLPAQGGHHLGQIGAQPLVAQQVGIVGALQGGKRLRRDPVPQLTQPLVEQGLHAVAPGRGQ